MTDKVFYSLVDKVFLVTGGGGGLGSILSEVLVSRGARVALVDLDVEAVDRVMSGLPANSSLALPADVTDESSIQAAVDRTVDEFGRLDVVVANAGVLGRCATFRTLSTQEVSRVMAVNVDGVVNDVVGVLNALQGFLNPAMDRRSAREPRIQRALAILEQRDLDQRDLQPSRAAALAQPHRAKE